MTYSFLVDVNGQKVGVADNQFGYEILERYLKDYGNLSVEVRDRDFIFGKGLDYGDPITTVKIRDILKGDF